MAVLALAADGIQPMMRVLGGFVLKRWMALEASLISQFVRRELIVRSTTMQRVARDAGELAAFEARGSPEGQILPATNAIGAIGPITLSEELGFPFFRLRTGEREMVLRFFERLSRSIAISDLPPIGFIGRREGAMALSANL